MRSNNKMPGNNPDNSAEPASLEFKQSRRAPPIQPWSDFLYRSALVRSCPPTIDDVHDCIVNYKPAGTQGYSQCRAFIREFDGRIASGQFIRSAVARNIPMSPYPCDTNVIQVRHLIEISSYNAP